MSNSNFEQYGLSAETGFLATLPDSLPEYFAPWHDLASRITELYQTKTIREETEKMPLLDSTRLQDYGHLRLAHLQLAVIAVGYAWQDGTDKGPKSIPSNLAIPLCDICDRTGLEAGASSASFMSNLEVLDKSRPAESGNVKLRYHFPGGEPVDNFWILSMVIELSAKTMVPVVLKQVDALKANDKDRVVETLNSTVTWVNQLTQLSKDYTCITGMDFFTYVAPFTSGFNDSTGYPDGILFEGVEKNPTRKTLNVSAAQSVTIPVLERLLGVTYPPEIAAVKTQWRNAWPLPHQRFYREVIDAVPRTVKDLADEDTESELAKSYNAVLQALKEFRTYHVQLATRCFIAPSSKIRAENKDTSPNPFEGMIPGLKGFREASYAHQLS